MGGKRLLRGADAQGRRWRVSLIWSWDLKLGRVPESSGGLVLSLVPRPAPRAFVSVVKMAGPKSLHFMQGPKYAAAIVLGTWGLESEDTSQLCPPAVGAQAGDPVCAGNALAPRGGVPEALTCPAMRHVGAPQPAPSLYAARASPGPAPLCSPSLVVVTLLHSSPEGREAGGLGLAPTYRGSGSSAGSSQTERHMGIS